MAGKFDTIGYPDAGLGSMARAGPNTPAWWSDTGPSWNPETGLDIYGNYGGPIGTSGPMGAGGGDRGDAANIANGWTQPSTGQTLQQPPAGSYSSGTSGGWGPYSNWITPPVPGMRGYAPPGYMISPVDGIIKIEDFHAWYGNKPTQPAAGLPTPTQTATQTPLTQVSGLTSLPNQTPKSYTNPSDFEGLNFASSDTAFGGANWKPMPMFHYAPGTSREQQLRQESPYMTRDNYEQQLNDLRSRSTPTTTGIGGLPTPDLTSTGQTPPIAGLNFNPATNSYNPFAIGAGGVGAGATGAGLFGSGLFGGQLQNYMMQPSMNTPSLYDALMGFRGGLFGQQLQPNAMMRMAYPGSNMNTGYPMQRSISQPMQQQFNQQQPAFFDSLAYRPL